MNVGCNMCYVCRMLIFFANITSNKMSVITIYCDSRYVGQCRAWQISDLSQAANKMKKKNHNVEPEKSLEAKSIPLTCICLTAHFLCSVLYIVVCIFVHFRLTIMVSVLLRFTYADCSLVSSIASSDATRLSTDIIKIEWLFQTISRAAIITIIFDLIWYLFWYLEPLSAIFQLYHGDQF